MAGNMKKKRKQYFYSSKPQTSKKNIQQVLEYDAIVILGHILKCQLTQCPLGAKKKKTMAYTQSERDKLQECAEA